MKWNIPFTKLFDLNLSHFLIIKNHDAIIIEKTVNINQNDKPEVAVNNQLWVVNLTGRSCF